MCFKVFNAHYDGTEKYYKCGIANIVMNIAMNDLKQIVSGSNNAEF